MKLRDLGILLSSVLFCLAGCSSSGESRKDTDATSRAGERRLSLSKAESQFNPSHYDDELDVVKQQHEIEQLRSANEAHSDSVIVESEPTQGYRIQIFATSSIDEATAMRLTAIQRVTEDSVYIVYDPPVYKVRIGDFRTRAGASQRLGSMSSMGFSDAWVVGDRIMIHRVIRVPSPPVPRRE